MKHLKNTFMTLLIISVFLSSFYVKSDAAVAETEYEEYHDQIDFDNLNLLMTSETSIDAYADTDSGLFDYLDGRKNLKKLENFLEQYPEKESVLAENMLKGTVPVAMSYTIAPCKEVDGHYERIEKEKPTLTSFISSFFTINTSAASEPSYYNDQNNNPCFGLSTTILRGRYDESTGKYVYLTLTAGRWFNHSFLGGDTSPASGLDFLAQSLPSTFFIPSNNKALVAEYTDNSEGVEGVHYKSIGGGDSYCAYDLKDDPFGSTQLEQFILATTSYANSNSSLKKAHSYYLHTWSLSDINIGIYNTTNNSTETKLSFKIPNNSFSWEKPIDNVIIFYE